MTIGLLIEITIAGLLIATCIYCYVLNRKLSALRHGQAEMLKVINKFDEASRRAESNLQLMQSSGVTMGRDLDKVNEQAHSLIDELSVMVKAGDHIAGRIESVVNDVRAIGKSHIDKPERAA